MRRIGILLADDHAILRAGLRMLIDTQADMHVVAEAGDGEEAVRRAAATRPDVAIMDLTMPGRGGVEAIERLRREVPATRVLVLTMHDDPGYAGVALAAGAAGHVVKDVESAELLAAIRAVHRGGTFVQVARAAAPGGAGAPLSARERQVLALLARGHTNRAVAGRLSLSVKTVETYRMRINEKLGLRTRADLVRLALHLGLLSPGRDGIA